MMTDSELRRTLLEFDKSRGQTGADYINGKITRQQADAEFENDIQKVLQLMARSNLDFYTQGRISEAKTYEEVKRHSEQDLRKEIQIYRHTWVPKEDAKLAELRKLLLSVLYEYENFYKSGYNAGRDGHERNWSLATGLAEKHAGVVATHIANNYVPKEQLAELKGEVLNARIDELESLTLNSDMTPE